MTNRERTGKAVPLHPFQGWQLNWISLNDPFDTLFRSSMVGPADEHQTYRRGQVEWALWRLFALTRFSPEAAVPAVFRTRIKRLLELDRETTLQLDQNDVPVKHAFLNTRPEGTGTDAQYTPFDAFMLAVGLDLLDAGFKQSEVVFLLRCVRPELSKEFSRILRSPPVARMRLPAGDRPGCPSYEENGRRYADCRVFVIIEKLDLKEAFPGASKDPVIFAPEYCRGIENLHKRLHRMNHQRRKALVLEIAHAAALVTEFLATAPLVKRGRG
jgi:hypothetical protein